MMKQAMIAAFLLAGAAAAHAQGTPAAGRQAFARCANCHAVPDPTLRADQLWTQSINGTA